ncbi:MAG: S8 family serine peptidase [Thiotrichaceae bacterium]
MPCIYCNRFIVAELYTFAVLIFGACLPVIAQAERAVVYLPEKTSLFSHVQVQTLGNIVQDLSPLPWLVIDTFRPITTLRAKIPVYHDVRGRFAATVTSPPDDIEYSKQWHLTEIGAPEIWQFTQGKGVKIALLDSGVDYQHPDLKENILYSEGYNFGDNNTNVQDLTGHGTAMAGLMVGVCHNQIGICGVAPQAKVIPFKINQQDQTDFSSTDLALAILTAAGSDTDIISMSLTLDEYAPWVEHALEYAKLKGKSLVMAAGNESKQVSFPANLPYVITVAAHDKSGERIAQQFWQRTTNQCAGR